MSNLKERLDLLREEIQKDDFLDGKGLSNEVNIRIFCYDPAEEMTVTHFLDQIKIDQSLNCRLIECNLYKSICAVPETSTRSLRGRTFSPSNHLTPSCCVRTTCRR